jgi:hypothetical protein
MEEIQLETPIRRSAELDLSSLPTLHDNDQGEEKQQSSCFPSITSLARSATTSTSSQTGVGPKMNMLEQRSQDGLSAEGPSCTGQSRVLDSENMEQDAVLDFVSSQHVPLAFIEPQAAEGPKERALDRVSEDASISQFSPRACTKTAQVVEYSYEECDLVHHLNG